MHLIGLSAACMAVLVSSARAALIDASLSLPNLIGTSQGSGNPIVKVPTVTNPNGQLTGQVISVSGGNPSAVKAQVLNPSTPNPGTTTVTGGNFNVLGTSVGASATVQTPGGTFNQITAQAVGDPEMRAFDGNVFEFDGQPGSFYEAVADEYHQVSISLKTGVMWDHTGTYMDGLGMKAHGQEILVTLGDKDCIQVTANNEILHVPDDGTYGLNRTFGQAPRAVHLDWQLFRATLGNSVRISTETMTVTVYLTRAGIKDKGGLEQPDYLNFEIALNKAPDHNLRGFMGETYNNLRASSSSRKLQAMWPAWTYHNNPFDYELPRYFTI